MAQDVEQVSSPMGQGDATSVAAQDQTETVDNKRVAATQDQTQIADNQPVRATQAEPNVVTETRPRGAPVVEQEEQPVTRADLQSRFGGLYWGSSFIGFAVALFFSLIFVGIVSAAVGYAGYQLGAPVPRVGGGHLSAVQTKLGVGAFLGSLAAVFLAYIIGGYTAGRMARFNGFLNGFGVWLWTIIVAVCLGIVAAVVGTTTYNVGNVLHLTVNGTNMTAAGVISIIATLIVMLLGATLGGRMGAGFHRRIDRAANL